MKITRFARRLAWLSTVAFAASTCMHTATAATPAAAPASATTAAPATSAPPASPVVGDHNTQLSDRIPPEQQLQLQAGDDKFAARYVADLSPDHRGSVIVLQDSGQHQSWPYTVAALFDDLPLYGWHVLALELPAPAQDATAAATPASTSPAPTAPSPTTPAPPPPAPDTKAATSSQSLITGSEEGIEKQAQARLDAALKKLTELAGKPEPTVLIGFGSGGWREVELARTLAAGNGAQLPEPLRALVLVDADNRLPAATIDLPKLLPTTALPTLDIVQNDRPQTRTDRELRRRAVLHQKERIYQQLSLPPLGAVDNSDQSVLIKRIRSWMQRYVQQPNPEKTAPKT